MFFFHIELFHFSALFTPISGIFCGGELLIQKFQTLFSLISLNIVKMLIFRSLIYQILLKIANSGDTDQTAPEGAV